MSMYCFEDVGALSEVCAAAMKSVSHPVYNGGSSSNAYLYVGLASSFHASAAQPAPFQKPAVAPSATVRKPL